MPRRLRNATGGVIYHVMNRGAGKSKLFKKPADFKNFLDVMGDVQLRLGTKLLAYCLLPDQWHMVLAPTKDGELSDFLRLVTVTHSQRLHALHGTSGMGPVYQGRYKSFPIQKDDHLLDVCRFVERAPVRAKLAKKATAWDFGSASGRDDASVKKWLLPLAKWPITVPRSWADKVNLPQDAEEEQLVLRSLLRGRPYGDDRWTAAIVKRLGLESTMRPRGRPRKVVDEE